MADRVVVFLDYQNLYAGAREAFHKPMTPHWDGQIDPVALASQLAADSPFERELAQVRVYRGQQDATRDPNGYAANRRQVSVWRRDPRVHIVLRTLRYPMGWPHESRPGERPQEKGIDVALAIDFATMAVRAEYDVGILMSTDTDLKPAIEFVADLAVGHGKPRAEVAAWSAVGQHNRRLSVAGRHLWCHWIDEAMYRAIADPTDYSRSSSPA